MTLSDHCALEGTAEFRAIPGINHTTITVVHILIPRIVQNMAGVDFGPFFVNQESITNHPLVNHQPIRSHPPINQATTNQPLVKYCQPPFN